MKINDTKQNLNNSVRHLILNIFMTEKQNQENPLDIKTNYDHVLCMTKTKQDYTESITKHSIFSHQALHIVSTYFTLKYSVHLFGHP